MLTVKSLSKSYGSEQVLAGVSLSLNTGDRLGLVGPNGCGKSTLLRILAGVEKPDAGNFQFDPPVARVGYLPQGMEVSQEETISSFLQGEVGQNYRLAEKLERLALNIERSPGHPVYQEQYDRTLERYVESGRRTGELQKHLANLGLDHFPPETRVYRLSGGQRTRLALVKILVSDPQLLLLDEPTNHLDLDMLFWLENWLKHRLDENQTSALIVSHDRAFMDATVNGILELDPITHSIRPYAGDFSSYLAAKQRELAGKWQEYRDQQDELERLERAARRLRDIARFRKGSKSDGGDKFARGFFSDRSKGTVAKSKALERRRKRLIEEGWAKKPKPTWQLAVDFNHIPESSRDVVLLEDLTIGYPGRIITENINQVLRQGERLALVGPNGSGKTTLLRTIAGDIPPLTGRTRLGPSVKIGYLAQDQETLEPGLNSFQTIQRIASLSETEARKFLHKFLFTENNVFVSTIQLSFGERTRLMLACLVASKCNLLLLDEPINHLDIPSRLQFEQALSVYEGSIIAVAHDRYFIENFSTAMWELRDGALRVIR